MSFSNQALSSKHEQFDDSENEKIVQKHLKHKQIEGIADQDKKNLGKYDNDRYVPLLPNSKLIKHLLNKDLKTRSVTHLVSI